jgi:hypothetical protein
LVYKETSHIVEEIGSVVSSVVYLNEDILEWGFMYGRFK